VGKPFEYRYSELVARATLPGGREVVVKVQLPDDIESEQEAEALRFWEGQGAVRLLAHAPAERALLIERCVPGTPLGNAYDDEAIAMAAAVMRRLWRTPSEDVPWRRLELEAARWLVEIPEHWERHGRPFDRRLLDVGLDALQTLGPTQEEVVLCHQDLHGGNILRAEREPWLAIDAKPIVAERAYDTVALVRDLGPHGLSLGDVRRRLDMLSELLELDRERMRGWGVAKHLAWGLDGEEVHEHDIEQVRLLAQA
jgi:streptomycin 6-kinase